MQGSPTHACRCVAVPLAAMTDRGDSTVDDRAAQLFKFTETRVKSPNHSCLRGSRVITVGFLCCKTET